MPIKASPFDSATVLSVAEMYAADRLAMAAGVPSLTLMESAGAAIAREIQKRWKRQTVLVLCGPGNNGGDGFVVARLLLGAGWVVRVALLGDVASLKGDAAVNAKRWVEACGAITPLEPAAFAALFASRPLVIDALFGAGLNKGLSGPAAQAIGHINALELPCVGVDVPSGVQGDSGLILPDPQQGGRSGVAPQCALTVTFFRPKPAHVLYPARALCGEVVVADIGIPERVLEVIAPQVWVNGPGLWALPQPSWESHKYRRGHGILFGGADMTGAARLAGHAARRVGVGLLTYAVPPQASAIYAADQPGAFVRTLGSSADVDDLLNDPRKNAALIGPGFGVGAAASGLVLRLLGTERAVVLDADALSSFAADPALLFEAIKSRTAPTVMTPHEGEFGRLFKGSGSKLARAKESAALSGAVVVLKGADTVIAAPDGRAAINAMSAPWLSTGGSGDILAGLILGLLAQGLPPWHAASAAAWLHGMAGAHEGPGLIAEDLPNAIRKLMKSI